LGVEADPQCPTAAATVAAMVAIAAGTLAVAPPVVMHRVAAKQDLAVEAWAAAEMLPRAPHLLARRDQQLVELVTRPRAMHQLPPQNRQQAQLRHRSGLERPRARLQVRRRVLLLVWGRAPVVRRQVLAASAMPVMRLVPGSLTPYPLQRRLIFLT
jgi:hypothetical protein